jgi:UDP-GlcNAc:undecaprenyl-phosphate GlcNAc-1-phosphate transferase
MTPYAISLALSFVLCLGLTPLFMRLAKRLDFMDRPNTALKIHKEPVPYLGGLAIFCAFVAGICVLKALVFPSNEGVAWPFHLHLLRGVYAILAGGLAALVLGLVDDARALSPKAKFIGQIFGACILVFFGLRIRFVENQWLSVALTVFWVVTLTNAMNFVDIMDGLAAGVGGIAALGFLLFSLNAGTFNDSIAATALAGACLGFLVWNFSPAKVYMGDAGSHFIGFSLAAISLNLRYSHTNDLAVFSPLLILALPLFDLILMTVIRLRKGIPPWKGSPDHIPLRLRALGLSKERTVLTLYAATVLLCAVAYASSFLSNRGALLVWGGAGLSGVFLGAWFMGIEMPAPPKPPTAAATQGPLPSKARSRRQPRNKKRTR